MTVDNIEAMSERYQRMVEAFEGRRLDEVVALLDAHPELLNGFSWQPPSIVVASRWNYPDAVQILFDRGANLHRRFSNGPGTVGQTALLAGASCGSLEVVKLLLDLGARVTDVADHVTYRPPGTEPSTLPRTTSDSGWNSLMHAADRSNAAMAAALLTRGAAAGIAQRSGSGKTAEGLATDPLIKTMLNFTTGSAAGLPAKAVELLVAHAPEARRREAVALLCAVGHVCTNMDRAVTGRLLMFMARDWIRSVGKEAAAAATAAAAVQAREASEVAAHAAAEAAQAAAEATQAYLEATQAYSEAAHADRAAAAAAQATEGAAQAAAAAAQAATDAAVAAAAAAAVP